MCKFSTSYVAVLFILLLQACNQKELNNIDKEVSKHALEKTEIAFSKMASDSGIQIAFTHYADENAVIKRQNDTLIMGTSGIRNFYSDKKLKDVKLIWKPDFVDVAASGELGYTYGKYEYIQKDSIGKDIIYKGVFHTVWKKNQHGDWRFVWD